MRIQVAVSAGVAATSAAGEANRSLGISISTGRAIPLDFHTPPPLVVFFTPPFFRLFRFTSRLPHGYCATAAAAATALAAAAAAAAAIPGHLSEAFPLFRRGLPLCACPSVEKFP